MTPSIQTMARSLRNNSRSSKTVIGLEIEPGRIAAAEVTVNGSVLLSRAASAELPVGAVRDGEVADVATVSAALKQLWGENKGLDRNVRVGVANSKIVVRTVDVPPVTGDKELAAAVRFVAAEELPMPLDSAVLDFQPIGLVDTPEGPRMRVAIVAARREMIDSVMSAVTGAGLKPVGIDLSAFAMVRVLGGANPGTALYLSVGGLTNLAVVVDGVCVFTRVAGSGVEGMAIELAERRTLTLEHARMWLTHVGLVQDLADIEGDEEIVSDARTVLSEGVRRLANDVRSSLEFHQNQMVGGEIVDRIILTGAALAIPGFTEVLETEVGLSIEHGSVGGAKTLGDDVDLAGATVAAGLAVEAVS